MSRYKLAVDTGGTFTDICLAGPGGTIHLAKELSTPEDPARAVLKGLKNIIKQAGIAPSAISLVLHGTTVATNAILEQKGARTALIATRGFRDIIFIGRQNRPHLYNFWALKPPRLLPRHLVLEITERVGVDGRVLTAPPEEEIESIIQKLRQLQVESVAVCLLHSYINPEHELHLQQAMGQKLPHLSISLSSAIIPEFREYERTSTTVINALVRPRVDQYVARLEKELKTTGAGDAFYIMQSNGGVITAAQARRQSARTVLSGPAGGVLAGVQLARRTGFKNLITADMGGTSMDICLIHQGEPRYTTEGTIGGHPLRLPMLDIHTIGAGGGSIARVDAGGALRVGPQSAGAVPGPACYNLGGREPTVTDANLVLGRLDPAFFRLPGIKVELAQKCIREKIAAPLGLTVQEAAEGIVKIVNAGMVRAIRVISVQRGYDPRDFTLVAFGGAGPLHAVAWARELGAPRVLIPPHPGVTSAQGMLDANVRQDYAITCVTELTPAACAEINNKMAQLQRQGQRDLTKQGFTRDSIHLTCSMDLRYQGQSYELNLQVPGEPLMAADITATLQRFHRRHKREYGYDHRNIPVELVTLRLAARGILKETPAGTGPEKLSAAISTGTREIYLSGRYHRVPVYPREHTGPDWWVTGPALLTQTDTTTLVWPGCRARGDECGNLIIETGVDQC